MSEDTTAFYCPYCHQMYYTTETHTCKIHFPPGDKVGLIFEVENLRAENARLREALTDLITAGYVVTAFFQQAYIPDGDRDNVYQMMVDAIKKAEPLEEKK